MPTTELTDPRPQDLAADLGRLLSDVGPLLEKVPHLALSRARKAAQWILADLYREIADGELEGLEYRDLLDHLVSSRRLPQRIQIQFQAIESFGTSEEHSDSGLTHSDVLPCLQALDTVVRWYLRDFLGSTDELTFMKDLESRRDHHRQAAPRRGRHRQAAPRRGRHRQAGPRQAAPRFGTRRHPVFWRLFGLLLSLAVTAIFLLQLRETHVAAGRLIGVFMENTDDGVRITDLLRDGPADHAGLRVGDVLLEVAGHPIEEIGDYDLPAAGFTRGRSVALRVRRGEGEVVATVQPGAPVDWMTPAVRGFVMLCCLVLAARAFYRSAGDLRGRLLSSFLFLLAVEMAVPELLVGRTWLEFALTFFGYLHTGAQIAIELHLASMIPERQRWLARHGWIVPLYYWICLGWGAVAAATLLVESLWAPSALPWTAQHFDTFLYLIGLPLWATAILVLLAAPAWTHPDPQGRQQARLVLLGFLPWSTYVYLGSALDVAGGSLPIWTDAIFPLLILPFPLSIWAIMELESRSHRRILLTVAQKIRQCDTAGEVARQIAANLESAFHPTRSCVLFRKERADELTLGFATGAGGEVDEPQESAGLARLASDSDEVLIYPDDLDGRISDDERDWLEGLRARVLLPLNDSRRGFVGLVVLGEKRSEESYSDRDLKLLTSLGGQIAMSLENLELQSRLHETTRIQREVLTRLQEQNINLVKECAECGACYDSAAGVCTDPACGGVGELALSVPVERTIGERYRLDKVLGKGGIGSVYEALDLRLNRRVAVKVLLGSVLDKPHIQLRFEREARVIAQLSHPNIVTLYDYGQTEVGNAFIVLELLHGTSLRAVLQGSGAMAPNRVADWLEPVLEGLKAAHRLGVVHRDLKPGNVFIARGPRGEKRVKLLDFGIAKIKSSGTETGALTVPGVVLGTLGYMAPEQVFGGEVDERADIYSVGVLVLEALLGRRPFRGRTPIEVLGSVAGDAFELPARGPKQREVGAILKRCLERDSADRWPSVADLQEALIQALRASPAMATGETSGPESDDATLAMGASDPVGERP